MTRATPHSFRQSPGQPVTPLKVIFLADTRPGHYHLAEGVIAAVKRLRPVEVTRIEVKRKWIVPTRWLRRRINAESFYPPRMLRMAYSIQADELPKADLVVSAGGETQMPNICVTRFLGVPNVFCGSLLRGLGRGELQSRHLVLRPRRRKPAAYGAAETVRHRSGRAGPAGQQCRATGPIVIRSLPGYSSAAMPGRSAIARSNGRGSWSLPSACRRPGARAGSSPPRGARLITSPTRLPSSPKTKA